MAVGEQHGHQRSTVSVNGRGQHFHVFTHANGRVDHDVLAFGVAHKVAVGVVGGRQGGGFDRNHLYAVCEEDGAASGQSLSNVSGSRFHVSARSLQRPLNLHQQGDHGRSDFDFMSFPTGKNRVGFGPHHFGEFGLWFKVDVWNVVGRAQVEVKERIVKLHGAERRRDPMAQRPNVRSVNRKGIFEGEGQPLAFVVNDGVSVFWLQKNGSLVAGRKAEFLAHLSHDAGDGSCSGTRQGRERFYGSVVNPGYTSARERPVIGKRSHRG